MVSAVAESATDLLPVTLVHAPVASCIECATSQDGRSSNEVRRSRRKRSPKMLNAKWAQKKSVANFVDFFREVIHEASWIPREEPKTGRIVSAYKVLT